MGRRRDDAPGETPHLPHRRGRQARCAGGGRTKAAPRSFPGWTRPAIPSGWAKTRFSCTAATTMPRHGITAFCPTNDEEKSECHEAATQKNAACSCFAFCWPPAAAHPLPAGRNTWIPLPAPAAFTPCSPTGTARAACSATTARPWSALILPARRTLGTRTAPPSSPRWWGTCGCWRATAISMC